MGTIETNQRATSPFAALMKTTVSLWIVVVMMAMSFGAGVIVKAISEPSSTATVETPLPGQIVAPPLTDDQLTGQLPEGHPDLDEDGATGDGQSAQNGAGNGGAGNDGDGGANGANG